MRTALIGLGLLVLGGVLVATGVLPFDALGVLVDRVWPILLFVVAITVVAELAAAAGVFGRVASVAARIARGRVAVLWLLVVLLAVVSTVFLSLDTTAVLLTPIVVLLARQLGLSPLPFAFATVWLANTGSLLLPVSNLTNLLAHDRLGLGDTGSFVAISAVPALVAVVVPVLVLAIVFRRSLVGRYEPAPSAAPDDVVLFRISVVVVLALLPALVSGLPVWLPASVAAIVLAGAFLVRRHADVSGPVAVLRLIPWPLLALASGLFLVVEAAHELGLGAALAVVAGSGSGLPELLRLAGTGMLAANAVDNLPAYLALEPAAEGHARIFALLIGVNAGPLVTPWASLATLLWHHRLTALGVELRWRRYVLLGLVAAPLTVAAATAGLWLVV